MAKLNSAVVTVLPPGVFITTDAVLRGGFDVHVVHADARAADDAQLLRGLDDLAGDFGFRTHDQRRRVGHDREQFRLRQPLRQHDDFEFRPLLQQRNAFGRDRVANDDFHIKMRREFRRRMDTRSNNEIPFLTAAKFTVRPAKISYVRLRQNEQAAVD